MLVGTDDGALDSVEAPTELPIGIGLLREGLQDVREETCPAPTGEPAGDGLPRAIPLRQVPPGRARAQNPQHAIEDGPMVIGRSSSPRLLGWEQRLEPLPRLVA
jgi:hypothetical protein